jgi:hypothetical protein
MGEREMTTDASAGLTRWDIRSQGIGFPPNAYKRDAGAWVSYDEAKTREDSMLALLADLRGKLAAMTDNRDVLVGQLQAAREHVEAERAKVREMHVEMQSAADLLLAINKRFHKRDPFAVTAIDMWLAKRALPASVDAKGADRG